MFKGKTAIITGGSGGIGKSLAVQLRKKGANIALTARDSARLESARGEILAGAGDGAVEIFSCDATDMGKTKECVTRIAERMGPPDFLFNLAGVLTSNYFENLDVEDFRRVMDINFFGTLHFVKAALPYFKEKKRGHIINMSSISGIYGVYGYSSYCSSKFAVTGLSECLRTELKPQGISVHVVMPPEVDTPMVDGILETRPEEGAKLIKSAGVLSADVTARAIVSGVEAERFIIVPGTMPGLFAASLRFAPSVVRMFTDTMIKSNYRGPDGAKRK